jgi:hypothetical protein
MKQLSLADARRIPKSASPVVTPIEDESKEEYFKKIDAKVAQAASELLNEGLTREELAKIAAHNLIGFWELYEWKKQQNEARDSTIQLLKEQGEVRERLGHIMGLRKGVAWQKKALPSSGAKATNKIKQAKVRERIDWYKHNYLSQASIDPKRKGKICNKSEMEMTMSDKFNIGLDAAKETVAKARNELRLEGVLR